MTLTARRTSLGDIAVLRVAGHEDGDTARLSRALSRALAARPQALVVDVHGVELGPVGVDVLLHAAHTARTQGCRVVVCAPSREDERLLAPLPAYPSVETATEGLLLADSAWL